MPYRDEYLAEFLRREGRGFFTGDRCPACPAGSTGRRPAYRCLDCSSLELLCLECCVSAHARHPLDVIERWTGSCFVRSSLRDLGLRVQLGNHSRTPCPNSHCANESFVVVHTNGIHRVAVDYCQCVDGVDAGSYRQQLLRFGWYPATHDTPATACTFRMLEHFHLATLQGKISAYDYYGALEKLTDNTGLSPSPDRYRSVLRIVREWRHLKMVKRGGRGHDESGVEGTRAGELAVVCPACPDPAVNLPDDWENAPKERGFLYRLFVAFDACFRLKRRLVSSEHRDPGLGCGWSYFVPDAIYRKWVSTQGEQKEINTCTGLSAVDHANDRVQAGYASTAAGLGLCSRHEFVGRNAVVDLQKGERYCNMDWAFASMFKHQHPRQPTVVSYDIACQWHRNLEARLAALPPVVRLIVPSAIFWYAIPKLHIHSHIVKCQITYSFEWLAGAGRTDGEGIERAWANMGPVCTSTREMGPGSRHDTLDDHWGYWNWQKLVGLGKSLKKKLVASIPERIKHQAAFDAFTESQEARDVEEWRAMVLAFEADASSPNPYHLPKSGLTEADVRLNLARHDAELAASGAPSLHNVTPSGFIIAGLDLEEQQRRIRIEGSGPWAAAGAEASRLRTNLTSSQETDITQLRTRLTRNITRFRTLQATYMPAALRLLENNPTAAASTVQPEDVALYLPSALMAEQLRGCTAGLAEIEDKLRDAQCASALDSLRTQLHIKSRYLTYKQFESRHQAMATRTRTLITRNETKIQLHAAKYQDARRAKIGLAGGDASSIALRELTRNDCRCMEDSEEVERRARRREAMHARRRGLEARDRREGAIAERERPDSDTVGVGHGEGTRVVSVSWIWNGADNADVRDALRVEWAKAWSRARRWEEEVLLVKEEMRRVLVSLEHRAQGWIGRREGAGDLEAAHAEGVRAFADSQVLVLRGIAQKFKDVWSEVEVQGESAGMEEEGEEEEEEEENAPAARTVEEEFMENLYEIAV
ncbi:hypothetical protein PLICRDRAFT_671736 [Plicaturopsis crispa FD-325 SS-3]|uniref:CxC2-like cysteine cluster KDZ transposase-associated domain-containing protein n=1 Tax=Plicaturopsis crispa FD-325 SS-3 TaxID=944288 RepID=A0A0C9SX00_PLICR|nr:hypothetical protein PLICRDRAFT_671736 [Plicaturopsis crispa FD-325 SS-3]